MSDVYNPTAPQVFWVNQQGELIVDSSTGVSKTQRDYQFIWAVNYDAVGNNLTNSRLSENIGNQFTTVGNNSITSILASDEYNVGFSETATSTQNSILSFVGNNNSITEISKWIDVSPSRASGRKFMVTVHPEILSLDKIQETNSDKIKNLEGGEVNDINIPLNIYFKMNALDPSVQSANFNYIDLNNRAAREIKIRKLKFLIENEAENRPFIFTIKFNIQSNWIDKRNKPRD
jgi:hypothetical protein